MYLCRASTLLVDHIHTSEISCTYPCGVDKIEEGTGGSLVQLRIQLKAPNAGRTGSSRREHSYPRVTLEKYQMWDAEAPASAGLNKRRKYPDKGSDVYPGSSPYYESRRLYSSYQDREHAASVRK